MPNFAEHAADYDASALIQAELAEWGAGWLETDLTGRHALEFGAGTGLFTRQLVKTGADLLATDLSPTMLREGRRNVPAARWQTLDAWNPSVGVKFDRLYSAALLQWCPSPSDALRHWKELLLPGGKILCLLFVKGTLAELDDAEPETTSVAWRDEEEWQEIFAKAELHVLRAEEESRTFAFADARALLRYLRDIGVSEKGVLSSGRLRRLLRQYDEDFSTADGEVRSTWNFFRIEAELPGE